MNDRCFLQYNKNDNTKEIYDYSDVLNRTSILKEITSILESFEQRKMDINFKKGIYIYGSPGSGKTHFVTQLLCKLGYDVIRYDAGDVRNKSLIESIAKDNISNRNVLDMMYGRVKKIAIVMDEIDGMNSGDKGGINALIKLIRQKKTQKQRLENMTMNPIICIGNYYMDKKIRDLMKVCYTFELKSPTQSQVQTLIERVIPENHMTLYKDVLLNYIQGDIRKLNFVERLYQTKSELLTHDVIQDIFKIKTYNEDSKRMTATLFNSYIPFSEHNLRMNDTDRTIIALLWHENIVDHISHVCDNIKIPLYQTILKNICFADYIDRITFQNQIWIFNEMSSLIKTFYSNKIYHTHIQQPVSTCTYEDIRFTKILTKYSTEYNNILFLNSLCLELNMDKKDVIAFFHELRSLSVPSNNIMSPTFIDDFFEGYEINCLDIRRIYRYLDKNVKKDTNIHEEIE